MAYFPTLTVFHHMLRKKRHAAPVIGAKKTSFRHAVLKSLFLIQINKAECQPTLKGLSKIGLLVT